jgi:hypothetical protein
VRALLLPLIALVALLPACGSGDTTSVNPGGETGETSNGGLVVLPPESALAGPSAELGLAPRAEYHDFGDVPDGLTVDHVFRIENRAGQPVDVLQLTPDCGCTVPSVSYRDADGSEVRGRRVAEPGQPLITLPAGAVLELRVAVDTRDIKTKNAHKLMSVRVTSNAPATRYLTLELHIFVQRPFQVTPEVLDFSRVPVSVGGTASVDIAQVGESGVRVGGVREAPDGISAELREEQRFGRTLWILETRLDPPLALGRHSGAITLDLVHADGEPFGPVEVGYRAVVVPDLQADPARLVIQSTAGVEPPDAAVEVYSLVLGQALRVGEVTLSGALADTPVEVRCEPLPPLLGERRARRWRLTLDGVAELPAGDYAGTATLQLDDAEQPTFDVPLIVRLR